MITILNLAFALLAGLLMTRIFNFWHLPDVTAFLVAGVLIGPHVLGLVDIEGLGFTTAEEVARLSSFSDVAMGFIAFSIGSEFRLSELKKTGHKALVIGIVQAVFATVLTDLGLLCLHFVFPNTLTIPAVLTLGAIAAATAPAATLMVVRQYKAQGELTSLLLPIVALDDAVGLIVFAVSFGIARALQNGQLNLISIIVNPIIEIVASVLLGALAGWFLTKLEAMFHSNRNRNALIVAFIILMVALAQIDIHIGSYLEISFSSLLVCMMLGTVFCNLCPLSQDIMDRADRWSQPLLDLFFVVSGAQLDLSVFTKGNILIMGIAFILFRSLGKYIGAALSAKKEHCSKNVVKYLGITLLPQAGVALGMCVSASALGTDGELIRNIVLFAVLVYELLGPLATKMALTAAGEISEKPAEIKERRANMLKEAAK